MKKISNLVLLAALIMTTVAQADYLCSSLGQGTAELTIDENHKTHIGDTVVMLEIDEKKQFFFGTTFNQRGIYLKKKIVEFYDSNDSLAIVSQPKQCGRAGCNSSSAFVISAVLTLKESTMSFVCNEKGD